AASLASLRPPRPSPQSFSAPFLLCPPCRRWRHELSAAVQVPVRARCNVRVHSPIVPVFLLFPRFGRGPRRAQPPGSFIGCPPRGLCQSTRLVNHATIEPQGQIIRGSVLRPHRIEARRGGSLTG
ncbi:unnamed protein product, partial [Ectocarpus sp. 13 AM-2016]